MTLSRDVRDGVKEGRLAGKSLEQIYRLHNALNVKTGKPLPGTKPHQGEGCQCDHCQEYLIRAGFR